MNNTRAGDAPDTQLLSTILSDVRQRRILSLLAEQSSTLTQRDLAVQLAARELERPPSQVPESERKSCEIALHHQKLPKLAAAGLIERTSAGISLVPWFPIDLEAYGVSVPPADAPEDPGWDLLAAVLKRPYRQHVVSMVAEATDPISLDTLASTLAEHDQFQLDAAGPEQDRFSLWLHHVDLPKLDALGVLEYDYQAQTVTPSQSLTPVQKG